MANTYYQIGSTITVPSDGTVYEIEFASIPQTYTDLLLTFSARANYVGAGHETQILNFNSSTTSYTSKEMYYQDNVIYAANRGTISSGAPIGKMPDDNTTAGIFGNGSVYIPNYTNGNYKVFSSDSVSPNFSSTATIYMKSNLWSNTAAISNIKMHTANDRPFKQNSTFRLYGIKSS